MVNEFLQRQASKKNMKQKLQRELMQNVYIKQK